MTRYKIHIEYEGTNLAGWQKQKNGISVQEILENALFKLTGEKKIIQGAGRTDAGVHALNQVAHFDIAKKIKTDALRDGLNFHIKNLYKRVKISVLKCKKVKKNFNARFDAKERTYQYVIINRQSNLALQKNKAWHVRKKLDLKAMKKGAKLLLGTHDFSTFRASSCGAKSPVRTLKKISIKKNNERIIIKFTSKSFLQQQVRSMVGCIKYLAESKWKLDEFKNAFKSKKRSNCARPAPSCGLYLTKISY